MQDHAAGAIKRGRARGFSSTELADELRRRILSGELRPGEPLPHQELAERYGVSRTPMREAINLLKTEGLVIGEPNRTAVVFKPSRTDLEQLMEIRYQLEALALRWAQPQVTPTVAERLDELNHQSADGDDNPVAQIHQYLAMNHRFHFELYELCGSSRLVNMLQALYAQTEPYMRRAHSLETLATTRAQHAALIEALRDGDADTATAILREHNATAARNAAQFLPAD